MSCIHAFHEFLSPIYGHHFIFLPSVPQPMLSASPTGILKPGSSVNLTCEATLTFEIDVDSLQITWEGPEIFDAYNITESHSGLQYSSVLNIQNVEEADEGEYTCTFTAFEVGTFFYGSIFVEVEGQGEERSSYIHV